MSTKQTLPKTSNAATSDSVCAIEEEEDESAEEVRIMEECASFDEIMIWGHEALPDEMTDPYIKGVNEWIAFAEKVSSGNISWRINADTL